MMTSEEIEKAACADPDPQPLTPDALKRMKRSPQVKIIGRTLELTQEEFALRYRIPLDTLRDWEQSRTVPDQPAQADLSIIARDPLGVAHLLNS